MIDRERNLWSFPDPKHQKPKIKKKEKEKKKGEKRKGKRINWNPASLIYSCCSIKNHNRCSRICSWSTWSCSWEMTWPYLPWCTYYRLQLFSSSWLQGCHQGHWSCMTWFCLQNQTGLLHRRMSNREKICFSPSSYHRWKQMKMRNGFTHGGWRDRHIPRIIWRRRKPKTLGWSPCKSLCAYNAVCMGHDCDYDLKMGDLWADSCMAAI